MGRYYAGSVYQWSWRGQLDGFVEKCDIVINCISPSHLYGKIVKDAVCKKDKIYIDPSDMSFEQEERNVTGKCVTSCGYIPGISEFLPYIVAHKQFDKIRRTGFLGIYLLHQLLLESVATIGV